MTIRAMRTLAAKMRWVAHVLETGGLTKTEKREAEQLLAGALSALLNDDNDADGETK